MRGAANPSPETARPRGRLGRAIDRACQISYELVLLAVFFLLAILPLHLGATRHWNIAQTLDPTHVLIRTGEPGRLSVGTVLPVYRYSSQWRSAIGSLTVQKVEGDTVVAALNPSSLRQPIGRHGQIVSGDSGGATVNIGANASLKPNDKLTLFAERKRVGQLVVTDVDADSARGRASLSAPVGLLGLTVSDYAVATQAIASPAGWVASLEYAALAALLLTYAWYAITRRRSPFIAVGQGLRGWVARSGLGRWRLLGHLLLAVPFVWFAAGFVPSLFAVVAAKLGSHLRPVFPAWPSAYLWPGFVKQLPLLYAVGGLAYVAYLFACQRSPIVALWRRLGWKPWLYAWLPLWPRRALLWLLHLVIAYAFASTLFNFLSANTANMIRLGWHGAPSYLRGAVNLLDPAGTATWIGGLFRTVAYMLVHAPSFASVENAFECAKYILWSITIVGVLMGYAHSILGPLWGKHIRNLDFTVVGWVTNAFCYPLLGSAIWQLVPSFRGDDLLFTGGLPFGLMLGLGFVFNLLYTISIWNLGTKFGVMTDKGVRTTGFYSVVRHPSYTLEAIMFILVEMNSLSGIRQWWSISMYLVIYWLRSEREDVFMAQANPDFRKYQEQTPYKFIPGVY